MEYREGILVSEGGWVNAAAIGAEISEKHIFFAIYRPSDTAANLEENMRFTFSLTDDPWLFYKAALTGHNTPFPELSEDELKGCPPFIYPSKATCIYFCRVNKISRERKKDEYGLASLYKVTADILEKRGEENYIGRDNPLVDAMVYASRYHIANKRQKDIIRNKIGQILEGIDDRLADKVKIYVDL